MNKQGNIYVIDFSEVRYYLEMHAVIKESLNFPDYYGCNWSALWDCLTDMIGKPIKIRIVGLENIERRLNESAENLIKILRDFKHYDNDRYLDAIQIEIIRNGKVVKL